MEQTATPFIECPLMTTTVKITEFALLAIVVRWAIVAMMAVCVLVEVAKTNVYGRVVAGSIVQMGLA
jgi:hypothetical protein